MKKFLSFLLCVLMLASAVSIVPFSAFAAGKAEVVNAAFGKPVYKTGNPDAYTFLLTDGNKVNNTDALKFQDFQSNLTDPIADESDNYLLLDLGAKYDVTSINIAGYTNITTACKVFVSNNKEAPISEWTEYGEMPKTEQTEKGYEINGPATCIRYVRVYVTFYQFYTNPPADNWFYLNEITVNGSVAEGETPLPTPESGSILISPRFGRIENFYGKTYFVFSPSILGGSAEETTTMFQNMKNRVYNIFYTVTDASTKESKRFKYVQQVSNMEFAGDFIRLPVCDFGFVPQSGHSYTLKLELYNGDVLYKSGESVVGSFHAMEGNAGSENFTQNGAILPKIPVNFDSPLSGKSIIFLGDSITEAICERYNADTFAIQGWPGRIGSSNGMAWTNAGVSGATMSATASNESSLRNQNTIYKQAYSNKENVYDLVIMQGGVNDGWFNHPVGSVTAANVTDPASFDLSTLAGGMEYTFDFVKKNYPNAKLGFIVTFKMPSSPHGYTAHMDAAVAEIIKACEKWDIPYLDLYHNAKVEERLKPTVNYHALGDYVHPNNRGYDILFPFINEFVKTVWSQNNLTGEVSVPTPEYTEVLNGTPILETDKIVSTGKPVTTGNGKPVVTVTDGNKRTNATFGTCGEPTCYAELDLGAVYDIDKVNVYSGGYNLLYRFRVEISLNGSKYVPVGEKNDDNMVFPEGYTVGFEKTSARYVRVYGLYRNNGTAYSVGEISVYGEFNEGTFLENLDLYEKEIVKVELPDQSVTTKLNDKNKTSDPATIGVIEGNPAIIDMGRNVALSKIACRQYESDSGFTILGSTDQISWTVLGVKKATTLSQTPTFDVSGTYRYLKIRFNTGRSLDGLIVFYDISVFDQSGTKVSGMKINNGLDNIIDNDMGSFGVLNKPEGGIVLDLGESKVVRKMVFYPVNKLMTFTVEASKDGITYSGFSAAVYDEAYDPNVGYKLFGSADARYFRIVPSEYVDDTFGLYEVEVYADAHIHDFTGEWVSDENNHYKVCTDPKCHEIGEKHAHTFDKGVVTVAPTATTKGEKVLTCTVCGHKKTVELPVNPLYGLENVAFNKDAFLYTKVKKEDADYILKSVNRITDGKSAEYADENWAFGKFGEMYALIDLGNTYAVKGVNVIAYAPYKHAWSVYLSKDNVSFKKAGEVQTTAHPNDGISLVIKETEARYIKVVADYYLTPEQFSFREVSVFGTPTGSHNHDFSGDWISDDNNHWKACTVPDCQEIGKKAPHTFDEGTVTVQPSAEGDGTIVYTCTVCGHKKSEVVPFNPAPKAENVSKGKDAWLYTKNNKNEADYFLKKYPGITDGLMNDNWAWGAFGTTYALIDLGANYTVSKVNVVGYAPYKHDWIVYISTDNKTFTQVGASGFVDHPSEGINVEFPGTVARYIKVVTNNYLTKDQFSFREVSVFGVPFEGHVHDFTGNWEYDANNHWKVCNDPNCKEHGQTAAHTFNRGVVTVQPTATTAGEKVYTCTVCGYQKVEVLPADPLIGLKNISLNKEAWLNTRGSAQGTQFVLKACKGLTDGKQTDNWAYGPFGELYALIDLGAVYDIGAVNVQAYKDLKHAWTVYVSDDNVTFEKVASVASTVHPQEGILLTFPVVSGRYVKVVADFYVTDAHFDFKEITVYGKVGDVPLKNIADSATVTLPDKNITGQLTNKDLTDFLEAPDLLAGYVTLDLKSALPVTKIVSKTYENDSEYFILGSTDGESWTILGMKKHGEKLAIYTLETEGEYRYIRLQGVGVRGIGDYAAAVTDLAAYHNDVAYTGILTTDATCVNGGSYQFIKKVTNYIVAELTDVTEVRKVTVQVPDGSYGVYVEYSKDGITYLPFGATAAQGSTYNAEKGLTVLPYDGIVLAKYLRISAIGSKTTSLNLSEIGIFTPSGEEPPYGDLDGDGIFNISDITAELQYLANFSGEADLTKDFNGDGVVNISDVTVLLNMLAGM